MKTTIGIDIRTLIRGNKSGIEEYTAQLLSHMLPMDRSIRFKLFYNGWKKSELCFDWLEQSNVELIESRLPNRLLDLSAYAFNLPHIDRLMGGVDKFFSPHIFLAPTGATVEKIVTFHDLSFSKYPEFYSSQKNFWHLTMAPRRQALMADKLIAMSESTKEDLIASYGIPEEKIHVISPGTSPGMRRDHTAEEKKLIREKYRLHDDYILCLCTLEPRKNILSLVKAFDSSKSHGVLRGSDCQLVIAGSKGWLYEDIFHAVKGLASRKDIIFTGLVDEADKPAVYAMSRIFVYPSFYEGFGFPPLEAMIQGVPVITSAISSIPETVQDATLLINPSNPNELLSALEKVLTDEPLRQRLIRKGRIMSKNFDWNRSAAETLSYLMS
jgi:glycosyltransferase involved in cell wall biosynthesis